MLYYNLDGQGTALKILYMLLCVFVRLFIHVYKYKHIKQSTQEK